MCGPNPIKNCRNSICYIKINSTNLITIDFSCIYTPRYSQTKKINNCYRVNLNDVTTIIIVMQTVEFRRVRYLTKIFITSSIKR